MIFVVGAGNKVKSKVITTSGTSELNFIVTGGLEVGDQVVVEGASKLKDDTEIVPQPVSKQVSTETASVATDTAKTQNPTAKK